MSTGDNEQSRRKHPSHVLFEAISPWLGYGLTGYVGYGVIEKGIESSLSILGILIICAMLIMPDKTLSLATRIAEMAGVKRPDK